MEFSDSYFEDEVREGYFVPSLMKRAWAAQLEVLYHVDKLCQKHKINYYAEWGTLLGAIRHGGMIPWDDDLDICMKGEDYTRFLSVADELPEGTWFVDYHNSEKTDNMVGQVVNSKYFVVDEDTLIRYHGFPYAASIDVFRLDYLPPTKEEEETFRAVLLYIAGVIGLVNEGSGQIEEALRKIETMCHMKIDRNKSIKTQLYDLMVNTLSPLYQEREARELTNLPLWSKNQNFRFPKECYEDAIPVPFENMKIMVPIGYERLLRRKYGAGYMNPVRDWNSHDYPFFDTIQGFLDTSVGLERFEYEFSQEEIEKVEAEREKKPCLQQRVLDFVPLFCEAHAEIRNGISKGEFSVALELLGECQNVAIQIGSLVEKEKGEGTKTVAMLENYCETLFCASQKLVEESQPEESGHFDTFYCEWEKFEQEFSELVKHELQMRKEIVFIPYKVSYWGTMASLWREAMQDEEVDVYVIPAPYYYKDELGNIKKEPHYECAGYPEEVAVTSYEEYNFQVHHPDVIVTQCPYDEYNYAMTLHPFFYAVNLKKYTDKLVYIPPFVMDEIAQEDERAKKMLKYFCNMPGVVHADCVIVQSEQMKERYVELLTQFAGEDTRTVWENKIWGTGSPVQDVWIDGQEVLEKDNPALPEAWMRVLRSPDGRGKKIVLYSTSASALLMHGQKMVDKIRAVLQSFFVNREQVALIWRPDPKVKKVIRKKNPGLWQSYRDLLQKYREEGWGIVDDSDQPDLSVSLCDACYGDGGSVMHTCRVQGKFVMLQDGNSGL